MVVSAPLGLKAAFLEALRTKSGSAAGAMLGFLILLAVFVPILAPYNVVQAWNDPGAWTNTPKLAAPEWSEIFSGKHLPRTILLAPNGEPGGFDKVRVSFNVSGKTSPIVVLRKSFSFQFARFPSETKLFMTAVFGNATGTQIRVFWDRPDGQEVHLFDGNPSVRAPYENTYSLTGPSFKDPSYAVYSNVRDWLVAKNVTNQTEWASLFPTSGGIYLNPPHTPTVLLGKLNRTIPDPPAAEGLKGHYSVRIELNGFTPNHD